MESNANVKEKYLQSISNVWKEISQLVIPIDESGNEDHGNSAPTFAKELKWQHIVYVSNDKNKQEFERELQKLSNQIPALKLDQKNLAKEHKTLQCLQQRIQLLYEEAELLSYSVNYQEDNIETIEHLITFHQTKKPANFFLQRLFKTQPYLVWNQINEQHLSQLSQHTDKYVHIKHTAEDKAFELQRYNSHLENTQLTIQTLNAKLLDFKKERNRIQIKYAIGY